MNNGQNDNDTLVSDIYRESAQETTPPQLDEAVLRMASNSKPVYSSNRLSAWLTPLTWTVTAGLCVALVMNAPEFHEDAPAAAHLPETASPAASIEEAFSAEDADVVEEAEKMARMRDGPNQPAPVARARKEQAERVDEEREVAVTASRAFVANSSVSADDSSVSVEAIVQELGLEKKEADRAPACEEPSRQQAASWYDCVLELRDSGRTEDADNEMLELLEEFPNFQPE